MCHHVICMMSNAEDGVIHVACAMHHVLRITDRHELHADTAASAAQQQHLCDDSNWWAVIPAHDSANLLPHEDSSNRYKGMIKLTNINLCRLLQSDSRLKKPYFCHSCPT